MKHKHSYFIILALWSLSAFLLRFWNLHAAVDELGLFLSGHPSTYFLVIDSGIFLLINLGLSRKSPGRGLDHSVLTYSPVEAGLSFTGSLLMLAAVLVDGFSSGDLWGLLLLVLGVLAAISMGILSSLQKRGNRIPLWELLPVLYLLLKLIFNFKSWSTDPLILDYCFKLLALAFSLLGVYGTAGFCFDQGCPRKTLFYCGSGIFFSVIAMVDGIIEGSLPALLFHLSLILWLLPSVSCLLRAHPAPQKDGATE